MKIVVQYETETREVEVSTSDVIYRYEITSRLMNQKVIDLRNVSADVVGSKLEGLVPLTDDIGSIKSIQVYADNGSLIKESTDIVSAYYRVTTQTMREGGALTTPFMVETFSVDIR